MFLKIILFFPLRGFQRGMTILKPVKVSLVECGFFTTLLFSNAMLSVFFLNQQKGYVCRREVPACSRCASPLWQGPGSRPEPVPSPRVAETERDRQVRTCTAPMSG